jgi:uncharacterized protein (TIGR03435 family)
MCDRAVRALLIGSLGLTAPIALVAQAPVAPAFEVSSVRLWTPGIVPSQQLLDTRVTLIGQSLRSLVLLAFRLKEYQLSAPPWLQDVIINIQATLPAGATRQQVPEMMQGLLAQRFGLVVRRERRLLDVYELMVDPAGTRNIQEVEPLNDLDRAIPVGAFPSADAQANADRVQETLDGPVRTVRGNLETTTVTARSMYSVRPLSPDKSFMHLLSATRMTMAELASLLERRTGQPVFDRTNLSRLYRFTLELPPLNSTREMVLRRGTSSPNVQAAFETPSIEMLTGTLKGLGLRLEKRRAEVETIVVDKIDRTPTDN